MRRPSLWFLLGVPSLVAALVGGTIFAPPESAFDVPLLSLMILFLGSFSYYLSSWVWSIRNASPPVLVDLPAARSSLNLARPIHRTTPSGSDPGMVSLPIGGGNIPGMALSDRDAIVVPADSVEMLGDNKAVLVYALTKRIPAHRLYGLNGDLYDALNSSQYGDAGFARKGHVFFSWLSTLTGADSRLAREQDEVMTILGGELSQNRLMAVAGDRILLEKVKSRLRLAKRKGIIERATTPDKEKEEDSEG